MAREVVTASAEETFGIAESLGRTLTPGCVVLLHGDLGAGKTVFVRGLAAGLGVDPDGVTSPTFVLIQHYPGRLPLVHADLYRLDSRAAIDDLGLEELGRDGVLAIEWAERLPRIPAGAVSVTIEDAGGDRRRIIVDGAA